MNYKYRVTVLTPTYNRCGLLSKLYRSLCAQTAQCFQWIVVDDGSTDETENYIKSLNTSNFEITYLKKENGGKHTALNYAHSYIEGEMVVIVDSDDYLLPDAVQTIEEEWQMYRNKQEIGVMSYLRGTETGEIFSKKHSKDFYIDDDIHYRVNGRVKGDRCEVVRTDLFKQYPFPVFCREKFMSEGWLWNTLALKYKTVYRNKVLYVCEYLEGGLTKTGRSLRMHCPLGMMEACKSFFVPHVRSEIQCKEMLLFWVYGLCAGYSYNKIAELSGRPVRMYLCLPVGYLLYRYWCKKYMVERREKS